MIKIKIPIWQDPDAKPIEGLPPMPKTITKWGVDPSEPKKDRTGIVHIGKDRKIEKVVFDD